MTDLHNFFEKFLSKQSLFKNKRILQSAYMPDEVLHRDEQIKQIANILAPCLRNEKPSNFFIYGKTGNGKTITIKHVYNQLIKIAREKKVAVKIIYVNCKLKKIADTEYRLVAELARYFGKNIPATGLPTDEVYKAFFSAIDEEKQIIVLALDEMDQLVKKVGDGVLYNITRINSELENAQLALIGISNDMFFANNLDPRVKSSLSEEEILFPPYNAVQIQSILNDRAEKAFKDEAIADGVIAKCAAYAAREHGDARRALDLLRVAAELAERDGSEKISIEHIDFAEEKIEKDRVFYLVENQPKQFQATLYSVILIKTDSPNKKIFTGDIYDIYKGISQHIGLRPLTQRRISDVIAELDMMGLINARVISKGRFGRTREIDLALPASIIKKVRGILESALDLSQPPVFAEQSD
ncbi:MAG: ORC1-type DNA replication protein [Candidatus Woesearchaeota archaeon]